MIYCPAVCDIGTFVHEHSKFDLVMVYEYATIFTKEKREVQ